MFAVGGGFLLRAAAATTIFALLLVLLLLIGPAFRSKSQQSITTKKNYMSEVSSSLSGSAASIVDTTAGSMRSTSDNKTTILRIASMNVAMSEPSAAAPRSSWDVDLQEIAIRDELLRWNPDVVMLQECPSEEWAIRLFGDIGGGDGGYNYVSAGGSRRSHYGHVVLLVKQKQQKDERVPLKLRFTRRLTDSLPESLPAVAAEIAVLRGGQQRTETETPSWCR